LPLAPRRSLPAVPGGPSGPSALRNRPELPGVEVEEGLLDLLLRGHDEGTVLDDRFSDRLSREDEDVRVPGRHELELGTVVLEEDQLARARVAAARGDVAGGDDRHRVVVRGQGQPQTPAGVKPGVEEGDRREGPGRAADALVLAGDDPHLARAAGE